MAVSGGRGTTGAAGGKQREAEPDEDREERDSAHDDELAQPAELNARDAAGVPPVVAGVGARAPPPTVGAQDGAEVVADQAQRVRLAPRVVREQRRAEPQDGQGCVPPGSRRQPTSAGAED
jgi:hypothetical protein